MQYKNDIECSSATSLVFFVLQQRNILYITTFTLKKAQKMFSLLLLAGSLLLATVQCDEARPSVTNATRILDSINKDLDEIKRTLAQAQVDRNRRLSGETLSSSAKADLELSGHYLSLEQENKDRPWVPCAAPTDDDSIYKYSIPYLNQSLGLLDFSQFRGKPLLLVNVATFCESAIEYPFYNQLKDRFGDKLQIFAFPSNQFDNVSSVSFLTCHKLSFVVVTARANF